jgi:hypothetical protein
VHVCAGGVFKKGPVDWIHGVPVRAKRTISVLWIRRENDPMWILAERSEVCVKWYQSLILVCILWAEGGRVDKENTLIHIKLVSELDSIYILRQNEERRKVKVLKLCRDCCRCKQKDSQEDCKKRMEALTVAE